MTEASGIHVIATTISGSIKDWGKVERIVPLFREMGREEATAARQVKKETSRKRANTLKKTVISMPIGLGFSQSRWNELVGIQRDVIRMKNEGAINVNDFKEVITLVNEKLDTLKKLRGWSKQGPAGDR